MPMVVNEQGEKRESTYLKYEPENNLIILSNLYRVASHYLKSVNKFVACHEKDCAYCASVQKKTEYNYVVNLNGKEGIMDIKPSVFFNINAIEKMTKKDKRHISWLVIKSGSGIDTEYTVSKDDNLAPEDIKKSEDKLEKNNEKLAKLMIEREKRLEEEYKLNLSEEAIEEDSINTEAEEVNPEDISL